MKKNKNFSTGAISNNSMTIVIVIIVVILGVGGYMLFNNQSTNSLLSLNKSPYDKLLTALNKTTSAKTMYAEYKTKVTSSLSSAQTGVTQTLTNNVDGSIAGSTDGKTGQFDMKIYSESNPTQSVNVAVINTENGDWYVKNAGSTKWQKFTKEEYEKDTASQPIDASLYSLNILSTLFEKDQALLKSIKKETVEAIGEESMNDTKLAKYKVEISTPDFINALANNPDRTKNEIEDSKRILKNAVLTAVFYVDDKSNYVRKLHVEAKKLAQLPNEQSEKLGVSVTHDILLNADLSRFDVSTDITAPDDKDVLGVSMKWEMVTVPLK